MCITFDKRLDDDLGIRRLKSDIVTQAVKDLRYVSRMIYSGDTRKDWNKELKSIKDFMYSAAPLELCGIEGWKIYELVTEQENQLWIDKKY